ncbi:protein adenylyltransferase SelO family protein [Moraxella pluranimalium]|uniref:Protein nucleotidyltransferase YdiU n=1 Tax=Moraxella pluranimalium TaxID=470453 RepID=A0A1T0CM21_9GAMM|nr:YdiU family protein [Moraxella pluranimalium]OOS23400.1 hypothetical protein B0680_07460 [Moraxella pluranimalium]
MKFITDYHKHDERLYRHINPMPLDTPKLGALNRALINKLGLGSLSDNDWQDVISGRLTPLASQSPHGLQPIAMAYAGHQFGQWAGQLGDGRGLLIAQLMDDDGRLTDLHLKGAGRTPYSRHGDGRAMIASTIREYLCGHALTCLGIGSSDAIGFVVSDTPIQRYQMERAAALLRVSDCHVRLGHIEWVTMYAPDYLSGFITHICQSYYPSLYDSTADTADVPALIKQIAINTAQMIAKWQLVGFSHGVMNTDNLNITGTTLDFGPFGFMESFNPAWINNHSDHTGRYTYQNQPMIGYWNLATVFKNLQRIGVTPTAIDDALDSYEQALQDAYHDGLAHKLGFAKASDETTALGYELLDLMKTYQLDYTNTFRALIAVVDVAVDDMANNTHSDTADTHERRLLGTLTRGLPHKALDTWQAWVARFTHLIQAENDTQAVIQRLTTHNPVYVLRNHMAHTAITHALADDFGEVHRLFEILSTPYQVSPKAVANDITPALADQQIAVSCLS